jgi:hypothetical protein
MGNNRGGPYQYVTLQSAAVAVGNGTELECAIGEDGAYSFARCQVTGITTATITFEGTVDGTNWTAVQATNMATGAVATTATADGTYGVLVAALLKFRARISAWTTGTIYVTALATAREPAALGYQDVDIGTIAAGNNNIGDVDVASIAAGENFLGFVGSKDTTINVTPTMDTAAYASGDLLFDSTSITGATRVVAGGVILQALTLLDKDDQGVAMTLFFCRTAVDFGTLNDAPNIDDTEIEEILGWVPITASDYVDVGGAKIACIRNIGLLMEADGGSNALFVAAMNGTGTPTYTATGLKLRLHFLQN